MTDLEDALKAEVEDDETKGFPIVGYVAFVVRMNPEDESLATNIIVPEGQMFYSTIGMLRTAQTEVEDGAISYSWLLADDDDEDG